MFDDGKRRDELAPEDEQCGGGDQQQYARTGDEKGVAQCRYAGKGFSLVYFGDDASFYAGQHFKRCE
jgi:hypothetical protein